MLLTVIIFIVILGVLILIHELGHFLSARLFGVKAEEFGFGYPPRLIGWVKTASGRWHLVGAKESPEQYEHTVWSLNWLPLGGFVKIKGENFNDLQSADSFAGRPVWQRFIMLFAGVFMNFVLAFVLLSFAFASGVPSLVDDHPPANLEVQHTQIQIMEIQPHSPAAQAGLRPGDSILSIAGQKIHYISDVQSILGSHAGEKVKLEVLRQNKTLRLTVVPENSSKDVPAKIGVGLVKTALVKYPWYEAIYRAGLTTLNLTFEIIKAFGKTIANLITHHSVEAQVAGPIGIAVLTGRVVKLGWVYVLQFAALLSINLAIINLLPIPALDGGRIFFLLIEKVKGKPVKPNFEAAAHQWGFVFLMLLMLLVVFKDLHTYGQRLWQAFLSVF